MISEDNQGIFPLTPDLAFAPSVASNDSDTREVVLAAYEQAIQLAPHEAIFHYHKGHVLEQLGRLAEAYKAYDEANRLGYRVRIENV